MRMRHSSALLVASLLIAGAAHAAPALTVIPSPINAGASKLLVTTQTKVTIVNAGLGPVKITSISLGGRDLADFNCRSCRSCH